MEQLKNSMKVTRKEVAIKAGVSTATVSNVFNGSNKVKKTTAELVRKVAEQLDYKPDMIARSMRTNRTMQIGLVVEDLSNPYYGEIIREFELSANEKGYFVNICTGLHNLDNYFDSFITRRMDGVFVAALPFQFKEEKIYYLVDQGLKVVTSGNVNVDLKRVSSIENDYKKAMEDVISYLYGLGHTRIAYLSGLGENLPFDLRCESYRLALSSITGSFDPSIMIDGNFPYHTNIKAGYDSAKKLLALKRGFSAVICGNDLMAMGAINYFKEKGLKVPEDISVVGFDGIEVGRYWDPSITTMNVDKAVFGKRAFDLLYSNIVNNSTGYYKNQLKLIERKSTGKCTGLIGNSF